MIETINVIKSYDDVRAVNNCSLKINNHEVFGLVGTNGAGKSTLMRMIAGVMKTDSGEILVDKQNVYDNITIKEDIFFVPDELYYFFNNSAADMFDYYAFYYRKSDKERFFKLLDAFGLDKKRKIGTYSKGMKKQLSIIIGLCSGTRYLLCDETFDGLDPVVRQGVKSLFAQDIEDRGLTPVITSHNLRELEDICDHVGLLHKGGVILSQDIVDMKLNIQKIQCVFANESDHEKVMQGLDVVIDTQRGKLHTYTIRGTREDAENVFRGIGTVFFELLPLSLEEIFISETEAVGYDVRKIILG